MEKVSTAVGSLHTTKLGDIDQQTFEDYTNAIAVCEVRVKELNPGIDETTEEFYTKVTDIMTASGLFPAIGAGTQSQHSVNSKGPILDSIAVYLKADLGKEGEQIWRALKAAATSPSVGVTNFLDFWWSKASNKGSTKGFKTSSVFVKNRSLTCNWVYFNVDYDFTSWRALFVSKVSQKINFYSNSRQLTFAHGVYEASKAGILKKLGKNTANVLGLGDTLLSSVLGLNAPVKKTEIKPLLTNCNSYVEPTDEELLKDLKKTNPEFFLQLEQNPAPPTMALSATSGFCFNVPLPLGLSAKVCFDPSTLSGSAEVSFKGISLGKVTIKNGKGCIHAGVGIASASVCISYEGKALWISGKACISVPIIGKKCKNFKIKIHQF